jgi:hypothetical protein
MHRRPLLALLGALFLAGCAYSTHSGLPRHIRSVEVPSFGNDTFYKGLETKLTRAVIEKINESSPNVRVVNAGGDARIHGAIVDVQQRVIRETADDRPASVRLTVVVRYSFEDKVEQRYLIRDRALTSLQASAGAGIYDVDRGEPQLNAEIQAVEVLANEIVRQTIGMW